MTDTDISRALLQPCPRFRPSPIALGIGTFAELLAAIALDRPSTHVAGVFAEYLRRGFEWPLSAYRPELSMTRGLVLFREQLPRVDEFSLSPSDRRWARTTRPLVTRYSAVATLALMKIWSMVSDRQDWEKG